MWRDCCAASADGRLININDLVKLFNAKDLVIIQRTHPRAVEFTQEGFLYDLVHKAGLAAARHARYAGKDTKRNIHIDIFEVVRPRAAHAEVFPAAIAPRLRYLDALHAREKLTGDGFRRLHDVFQRAFCNNMPAVFARSGANIHNIVRRTDRIFIVFNHNERISKIAHSLKRCEQARVIPLVQADARFVKDIQHAHKAGTDLRGQADALCFAAESVAAARESVR